MPKRGFIFNSVSFRKVKRNAFNLDYENKFTGNMGELLPFFVQDVVPHDTLKCGNEYLMRLQPLLAPLMHRVDIRQHYFNVPLRLIWEDFEKFITGGEDGTQTAEMPYFTLGDIYNLTHPDTTSATKTRKLLDLLGYPTFKPTSPFPSSTADLRFSTLRIRAYNLIYNTYYRDQLVMQELANSVESGHDCVSSSPRINVELQNRCWKKDYFTSALVSAQRGPSVGIPWSGGELVYDNSKDTILVQRDGETISPLSSQSLNTDFTDPSVRESSIKSAGPGSNIHWNVNNASNLSVGSLDIDINNFRRSLRVQEWLERNNSGGARYIEQILNHFGIRPKDYRLDLPEHLGGGSQPLNISDVVQTSAETEDGTPLAQTAGKGMGFNSMKVFRQTFDEHSLVIGLCSVLPRSSYQQGVSRHLRKFDKFDFLQPEFGNLGEQEVYNSELYLDVSSSSDAKEYNEGVFGFQSRYSEYKYTPDEIHGDFKDSLSFWTLGRVFANRPHLNGSFLVADPSKRIFAVTAQDVDSLLFDFYNHCTALRCLPAYGTPTL